MAQKLKDLQAEQARLQQVIAQKGAANAPKATSRLPDIEKAIARLQSGPQALGGNYDLSNKKVRKQLKSQEQAYQNQARAAIPYQNPNMQNPFYSQTTEFDANGNPVIKQTLTPEQQQLLQGGQGLAMQGQQLAANTLGGYTPFAMGQDLTGDRNRIENEVYDRLTRTTNQDYDREKQQLEQTLYNRGIPLDPSNPQYKSQMDSLNQRYDTLRSNARAQATELGGQELQRSYGMGLGTHQQQLADVGALQNLGIGFQTPAQAQFNAPQFNFSNPTDIDLAMQQLKLQKQQLAQQNRGGGGAAAPEPTSPFNAGLPPGYSGGVA